MALIARDYDNIRLTGFVRNIPQRPGIALNQILPDLGVNSRTFRIRSVTDTNGEAQFRNWDTPSPVTSRPGFSEKVGSLPPISEAMIIGEDERLGIYERVLSGDYDDQVEAVIFDDAARLVRRVRNRVETARAQVLTTGAFTVAGENGLYLGADFEVPAINLIGGHASTTAALNWLTDPTADIIGEIRTIRERALDEHGEDLATMTVSSTVASAMLLNDDIRNLLSASGVTPSLVTPAARDTVLTAHGLPRIQEYNYMVNGTRLIDAETVIFTPAPSVTEFGRTEWGTTAEALELDLAFADQPGLVGMVMRSEDPVQVKTQVAGITMPVLHRPELLYTFDVSP
jgi:hypothetical protein